MKFKTLAIAAALVAAGTAHAAINDYKEAGAGSMVLSLVNFDNQISATFDLGLTTASFDATAFSAAGTLITWNLNTGTVGGNTSFAGTVSGSWADAWNAYKVNAVNGSANSRFGVWGGDNDLNGATGSAGRRLVSTSTGSSLSVLNSQLTNALGDTQYTYFFNADQKGNHQLVDNGANVCSAADGACYEGNAAKNNFGGVAGNITATQQLDLSSFVVRLQANGTGTTTQTNKLFFGNQPADLDRDGLADYGKFSFNAQSGVLTYAVPAAPVPEPGTYALLMAGLAAVGLVARRRRQA